MGRTEISRLRALRNVERNGYAKRPFGGPQRVLEYLGRYTHRVAIANSRLVACENGDVRFRWKDYRANNKSKVMTLDADELVRRFLLNVLPKGFRRIRHFGFLANACRTTKLLIIRAALEAPQSPPAVERADYREPTSGTSRCSKTSLLRKFRIMLICRCPP